MAQVQKDEQREKILESAKGEFTRKGIPGASMRTISKNAGTTVGNVYRYYKNKQELVHAVLNPTLEQLKYTGKLFIGMNGEMTGEQLSQMTPATLNEFLENWVDILVDVQARFPVELYIILNDEQINTEYQNELIDLIRMIMSENKTLINHDDNEVEMLSGMIAKSVFSGIREGVCKKYSIDISKEGFSTLMKKYMKHSFSILKEPKQADV